MVFYFGGFMNREINSYVVFILILILPTQLFCQQALTPEQIYERVNNAVVIVLTYDFNDVLISQGSGVIIGEDGYVLTNLHLFDYSQKAQIINKNKLIENVDIVGYNDENDIIILQLPYKVYDFIDIAETDDLKVGQRIYAIGSPLGYENTLSEGIISGFRTFDNDIKLIQITASISSGSSGGAVVNSKAELIGISTYTVKEGQNLNFAIPINLMRDVDIKPYLSEDKTKQEKTETKQEEIFEYSRPDRSINYDPIAIEYLNKAKILLEIESSDDKSEQILYYLNIAIKNDSNLVEAYYLAGEQYFNMFDLKGALPFFNKIETFIDKSNKDVIDEKSNREILIWMAGLFRFDLKKENYLKAIELFKKALYQPLPANYSYFLNLEDDDISRHISLTYRWLANQITYENRNDYFEANEYYRAALDFYNNLSHKTKMLYEWYKLEVINDKNLAKALWENSEWEPFYRNPKRKKGKPVNANNILFLYHPKTMTKKNNIIRIWINEVNLQEPNYRNMGDNDYLKSLFEFDLKDNRYRVLQSISYLNNTVISDNNYPNAEWQFVAPETIAETMVENLKIIVK